ncbi:hypothetical protein Gotur_028917 [Gossypium turneri]
MHLYNSKDANQPRLCHLKCLQVAIADLAAAAVTTAHAAGTLTLDTRRRQPALRPSSPELRQ